jgi:hypothetical protein
LPCADVAGRNSTILCLGSWKFGGKFALFWWQFRCVYVEIWQGNLVEKIGAVAGNL